MSDFLGHYRVVSRLGAGGMGEVFLGIDTRLGRQVAIKRLRTDLDEPVDEAASRRILREARIVASIEHPNVCTIYEVGVDNGRPYIVMQYVEGETLLERMQRGPIPTDTVIDIACQITAALSEAHWRGVVHRDIKAANVMIGPSGVVKVLDFGLAKWSAAPSDATVHSVTGAGLVAGTLGYMSPEQLRGETLDGRSDIFSLGVLLYEMATNRRPFDRHTATATIAAILTETPPPLEGPLGPIIQRALARNLAERWHSAAAMRAALMTAAADSGSYAAVPVTSAQRPTPVAPSRTVDPEAETLYLRGRAYWNRRQPAEVRQAIACFQEALERDPHHAAAFSGLADAYLILGFLQVLPPRDVMARAKAAAQRAIQLDPALAEPHASLGYLAGFFEWDRETSRRELGEAMRLDPRYAWAPHWHGLIVAPHDLDEALASLATAQALDPLSPIMNLAAGIALHQHRRFRDAMRVYSNVLQTELAFAPASHYLGLAYEQLGDHDAATTHITRALETGGRNGLFLGSLGHVRAQAGDIDGARQILAELEERSHETYISPYNLMIVHLGLGEMDEALTWLARAFEERNAWLWAASVEPRFDPLRGDRRFERLLSDAGVAS